MTSLWARAAGVGRQRERSCSEAASSSAGRPARNTGWSCRTAAGGRRGGEPFEVAGDAVGDAAQAGEGARTADQVDERVAALESERVEAAGLEGEAVDPDEPAAVAGRVTARISWGVPGARPSRRRGRPGRCRRRRRPCRSRARCRRSTPRPVRSGGGCRSAVSYSQTASRRLSPSTSASVDCSAWRAAGGSAAARRSSAVSGARRRRHHRLAAAGLRWVLAWRAAGGGRGRRWAPAVVDGVG